MTKFADWVRRAAPALKARFSLTDEDVAAIMGNAGHESGGFLHMQELHPTVKGSRGGYGIFQWTGPRRRNYENFCTVHGYHPDQYEANIGFLIEELAGPERGALAKLKAAHGLYDKTVAFEAAFERAGVKHYDMRYQWAQKAYTALRGVPTPPARPVIVPPPPDVPKPDYPVGNIREGRNKDDAIIDLNPKVVITTLTGGGAVGVMSILNGISNVYGLIAFLAIFAVIGFILYRVWNKKRRND